MSNTGGSFIKEKNKKVKLVQQTKDHPEGNRPRDAKGEPLNKVQPQTKAKSTVSTDSKGDQ